MPIPWLSVLTSVPWSDVVKNAPAVVDGARRLWKSVARKTPPGTAAEAHAPSSDLLAPEAFAARIAALEAQAAENAAEMVASSELIKTLAEQNTQLIQRIEALRLRQRWLTLAVVAVGVALGVVLALR